MTNGRLLERLRSEELLPLGSRMRVRLALERTGPDELQEYVVHALQKAGAVKLMTPELIATLCDHAQGNPRALMNIASELLAIAAQREARQIERLLLDETPIIYPYFYDYLSATQKSVTGVYPTAIGELFLWNAAKS